MADLGAPEADTDAPLDLLIDDIRILTGDPSRPNIERGRIGVRRDRIALLKRVQGGAPPALRTMAGAGLLACPGFVNVHTHAALTMLRGVAEDLGFAPAYTLGVPQGHDLRPDEAVALARLGALEALKFGSTLINDTYEHAELTLPAMGEIGLRVTASGRIRDVDFAGLPHGRWRHEPAIGRRTLDDALALHERFHGMLGGRLGVQLAAHAPDTCSTDLLREVREARDATGMRVTTHLAQSRLEVARIRDRDGRSPVELLDDLGLLDEGLIAAHCIWMSADDIKRAGRAGIFVAHIPKGNATGGAIAPTVKLRAAGARLALATDNMHADMVETMRWGLNVARIQEGGVSEAWRPADVFAMATGTGAAAMGLGDEMGCLRMGAKADIVLLDTRQPHWTPLLDPLGSLVHVGQGRDVRHVLVDGRVVVEDGRPTLVSEEAVINAAQAAADDLWRRAAA